MLDQVSKGGGKSLIIDFEDLIAFDPALARQIIERPDQYIDFASIAATAQMRVENAEYTSRVGRICARFRRLPDKITPRAINAENIGRLVFLGGVIGEVGRIEVMLERATFRCRKCLEIIVLDHEPDLTTGPGRHCPFCRQPTYFELIEDESKFVDCQNVTLKDPSIRTPVGAIYVSHVEIQLKRDLVDTVQPGYEVDVTAVVRVPKIGKATSRSRKLVPYLDANYIERTREQIGNPLAGL